MEWRERERGLGTLPPAWDLWRGGFIVGAVFPAREDGHVAWHAHRSPRQPEAGRREGMGNSHLGNRNNIDDAKRLVEAVA
jgi:hypothetical protein